MFRNIYLQSYKNSTATNGTSIEFLLTHFNHVYSTLGSILNDIEFAFGKLMLKPRDQKQKQKQKESSSNNNSNSNSKSIRQSSNDINKQIDIIKQNVDSYKVPNAPAPPVPVPVPAPRLIQRQGVKDQKLNFEEIEELLKERSRGKEKPVLNTGEFEKLFGNMARNQRVEESNSIEGPKKQTKPKKSDGQDFFDSYFKN